MEKLVCVESEKEREFGFRLLEVLKHWAQKYRTKDGDRLQWERRRKLLLKKTLVLKSHDDIQMEMQSR